MKEKKPLAVGDRVRLEGFADDHMSGNSRLFARKELPFVIEAIVDELVIFSRNGRRYSTHRRNIVSRIVKKPKRVPREWWLDLNYPSFPGQTTVGWVHTEKHAALSLKSDPLNEIIHVREVIEK